MSQKNFATLIMQDRRDGQKQVFSIADGSAESICEELEAYGLGSVQECMNRLMNDESIFFSSFIVYLSEQPIFQGPNLNEERWIEIYGMECDIA
jgi:hypothetical protein